MNKNTSTTNSITVTEEFIAAAHNLSVTSRLYAGDPGKDNRRYWLLAIERLAQELVKYYADEHQASQ